MNKIVIKQVQSIKKQRPNAITFEKTEDRIVELMGLGGLEMKVIASVTGLNPWQVATRLRKLGLSVRDYRRGRSPVTSQVLRALAPVAAATLDAHIANTDGFRKNSNKPFMRMVSKQPVKLLQDAVSELPAYKAYGKLQLKG